ncbi:hypothetical protein LCGC14_3057070, partial [marine sediment metagenome]
MYTKGEWTILALERGHEDRIKIVSDVADNGYFPLVCFVHGTENREANAHLIAAAVNACIKLNPDNPQAVADSIGDMYEAVKQALRTFEAHGITETDPRY